ncbi:MAG: hypothetical protein GYB31_20080 [Bacteroidetes bacterium]|nr:hypothetical protein [Bacteroidota bacterium]
MSKSHHQYILGLRRYLRKQGYAVSRKDQLVYRLIRVYLPDGKVEVLMTTLTHTRKWPAGEYKSSTLCAGEWKSVFMS